MNPCTVPISISLPELNSDKYFITSSKEFSSVPESDELIELFKQHANSNSMWYQGWDVLNRKEESSGRSN